MKTNKTKNRFTAKVFFLTALLLALILSFTAPFAQSARAAEPTDEIEHFIITVDVQEDASLLMTYHIDWKVLDDETYGPLEWVNIGLPNSHHSDVTAIQNVSSISDKGSSLDVYLDRNYYADEVASFEFSFVQDHMYQIDRYVEGETVFAYTPAWFDGIEVTKLVHGSRTAYRTMDIWSSTLLSPQGTGTPLQSLIPMTPSLSPSTASP